MLPLSLEVITYRYEADELDDPMCEHSLNLAWDRYGSTLHSASFNCARRKKPGTHHPLRTLTSNNGGKHHTTRPSNSFT